MARIGGLQITKPMLNQWMTIELGEDYYAAVKRQVPMQLVSEPPNYPACVSALKQLAAAPGKTQPAAAPSATLLRSRCEQLYQAIKEQALTFLVGSDWVINFDASHHVTVTEREVEQVVNEAKAKQYPKPGQFQASLKARRRTLGQEMFLAKVDVLQSRFNQLIKGQSQQSTTAAKDAETVAADATCQAGYVVARCQQFESHGSAAGGAAPSALIREIAG